MNIKSLILLSSVLLWMGLAMAEEPVSPTQETKIDNKNSTNNGQQGTFNGSVTNNYGVSEKYMDDLLKLKDATLDEQKRAIDELKRQLANRTDDEAKKSRDYLDSYLNDKIWGEQVLTKKETIVANRTGRSGNWRHFEICVSIPENGFMLKDTVSTKVISGVGAGSWGDWEKDIKFVNNNAFGPTKVCRGFNHQIHDQDRVLEMSVNYKIPKAEK